MRIARYLPLLLVVLLLEGCTVGRFVKWNFADRRDHKKFPSRPLPASTEPFQYPVADKEIGPRTANYPADCLVEDCLIYLTGRVEKQTAGVNIDLGQSARVYAQDGNGGDLSLPLSALVGKDGQSAVWVIRAQTAGEGEARRTQSVVRLVPVKVGAFGEDRVPVLSGLKADDWVVSAGVHLLREGQAVKPIDRKDRAVPAPGVAQN